MNEKRKTVRLAPGKPKPKAKFPEPHDNETARSYAELCLSPSVHGAAVAHEYMKASFSELDMRALVDCMSDGANDIWGGDMKRVEAMLYGQAAALQAIFTSLARRANSQEYLKQHETLLRLALKAQSQCRSTVETLASIKAGPAIFARQANIAHGPQQVNNCVTGRARPHEECKTSQNEVLEVSDGKWLDAGTAVATGRSDPEMETMGKLHRTAKWPRESTIKPER